MTTQKADTLPPLDSEYALPDAAVADFRERGHVLLRGLATRDEAAAYGACITDAVERRKAEARGGAYQKKLEDRDTYSKAFLQLENLWRVDEGVARFTLSRRFAKVAADLLGVDGVRVYHDQALFKEPGGGHTPWHQDQFYWPLDTDKTVTMWMPLVDASIEMGTLVFADGSHRAGPLASLAISDESERVFRELVMGRNARLTISEMSAGDATWHYGWTLHKAPGNSSGTMRAAMTIIYVADGARLSEWKTKSHPHEASRWLPGLGPGDPVDSELNPVAYRRGA
jgi:ectoine hydroxylase-related dioxygenase (phytanoyl-CoA dioxygenase family)